MDASDHRQRAAAGPPARGVHPRRRQRAGLDDPHLPDDPDRAAAQTHRRRAGPQGLPHAGDRHQDPHLDPATVILAVDPRPDRLRHLRAAVHRQTPRRHVHQRRRHVRAHRLQPQPGPASDRPAQGDVHHHLRLAPGRRRLPGRHARLLRQRHHRRHPDPGPAHPHHRAGQRHRRHADLGTLVAGRLRHQRPGHHQPTTHWTGPPPPPTPQPPAPGHLDRRDRTDGRRLDHNHHGRTRPRPAQDRHRRQRQGDHRGLRPARTAGQCLAGQPFHHVDAQSALHLHVGQPFVDPHREPRPQRQPDQLVPDPRRPVTAPPDPGDHRGRQTHHHRHPVRRPGPGRQTVAVLQLRVRPHLNARHVQRHRCATPTPLCLRQQRTADSRTAVRQQRAAVPGPDRVPRGPDRDHPSGRRHTDHGPVRRPGPAGRQAPVLRHPVHRRIQRDELPAGPPGPARPGSPTRPATNGPTPTIAAAAVSAPPTPTPERPPPPSTTPARR